MAVSSAQRTPVSQRVRRSTVGRVWGSTVGKKAVMAVSGAILFLYVVGHMLGNLKAFAGAESLDGYGVFLREFLSPVLGYGGFVWVVRVVLTLAVVLHMVAAVQLTRKARKARPVAYAHRAKVQGSYAARTMRWGGVIIVLFLVYHLLDLTAGVLNPNGVEGAIHDNVVADFTLWYVVLAYTVAVVALGFHLRHGLFSALRSLGLASARRAAAVRAAALGTSVAITVGFLAVPFGVVFGIIK